MTVENVSWAKRRTLSLAVKSSQLKPLANKLTALIGPMKQARDVIVGVLDTVGEGNFRKSKALRNAVTGLINVEDDLNEAASALNAGQVNNTELSLATGESPHVVVARAQVKAIEQVTGKLTKLSPGGFGWFHIKQAVKNLKQAQEELYNLIEESSEQP